MLNCLERDTQTKKKIRYHTAHQYQIHTHHEIFHHAETIIHPPAMQVNPQTHTKQTRDQTRVAKIGNTNLPTYLNRTNNTRNKQNHPVKNHEPRKFIHHDLP